jgi:hypothetical protein
MSFMAAPLEQICRFPLTDGAEYQRAVRGGKRQGEARQGRRAQGRAFPAMGEFNYSFNRERTLSRTFMKLM